MDHLTGKSIIFTDQHFGVKGNSPLRQRIGAMAVKQVLNAIQEHDAKNVIFCGDYFHQRNALTVDTLNIAYKCLQALAKKCRVYMVLGNHDLFNKNSTDVNSINIFRDNDNVEVIDQATEVDINGKRSLLVPWLADLTSYSRNQFYFMFGHFDISSKFLIASYAQEHSRKISASSNVASELSEDMLLDEPSNATSNLDEYLGNFIELVEESGTIFAGHIHQHKEMIARRRKFIFVGSPYEQTLGDIGCKCGFYLLNEDGSYKFIENTSLPKHVQVFASAVKKHGIDKYDFSLVKGNIVQKVYDIDIPMEDDLKINQKIASFKPYEELLPDYQVALDFTKEESGTSQDNLMKMLKKSKLDYIESYVNQLDEDALAQSGVAKEPLLAVLRKYYANAVGE